MPKSELSDFFSPKNVVLVGASDKSQWSALIHSRFGMWDHLGELFAVNRDGKSAHGLPGFKSCTEIDRPVDMAYIYVPASAVGDALRDAAAADIRHAVVLSSGFAEVGEDGEGLQRQVAGLARELDIRLMGPNSLGFANVAKKAVTTTIATRPPAKLGSLAIVSQSGAIAQEIYNFVQTLSYGVGFVGASGNEADITLADIVEYLVEDPAIGAIMLYIESIQHPDRFIEAAKRAFAAGKPIVLLKVGRSEMAAAIAQAHTGSLVGDDAVFDAMCHRYGISRVSSIEELVVTASLLNEIGPIDPPRVGMTSISGGACANYVDLAAEHGLSVPQFADETKAKLRGVLPTFAATLNPLDITGAVVNDPELWSKVIPILKNDPGIGLVVTTNVVPSTEMEMGYLRWDIESISRAFAAAGQKMVVSAIVLESTSAARQEFLEEIGLDVFLPDLDLGIRALAHLERWSERRLTAVPTPNAKGGEAEERPVGERATLDYLARRGVSVIPSRLAATADEAAEIAGDLGGRLVLKIASPDIAHKTEAGGVRLNVVDSEAGTVFEDIVASARRHDPDARIDGVLVSPMRESGGVELIVGVARDPQWGPAIAVGIGGTMAEILDDSRVRLLPIGKEEVREMLLSLRMAALLQGFRGAEPADLDTLSEAIFAIGDAALALGPKLAALEINPLRVAGNEIEALDALAVYSDG